MVHISPSVVLRDARRIVVKVGSSLVTNDGRGLDEAAIGEWCRQMAHLIREGREVIMVSSGAIAEGMKRLGWSTRPKAIQELQAAAAVGQMGLAQMYETKLRMNGLEPTDIPRGEILAKLKEESSYMKEFLSKVKIDFST